MPVRRGWSVLAALSLMGTVTGCVGRASDAALFRPSTPSSPPAAAVAPSSPTAAPAPLPSATPADAFATPADSATPVDAATAERVFRALYGVRSVAVHEHRADALRLVETGAVLEYDVARCALGCPTPPITSPDVPHSFSAPPQSGYPAFFMARVTRTGTEGQPVHEIVVFTRATPRAPWLVALDAAGEGPNPLFDDGNAGLGRPVRMAPGVTPGSIADAFASYWQHWWDEGSSDGASPFVINEGLTTRGSRIYKSHDDDVVLGAREDRTYAVDPTAGLFTVSGLSEQPVTCAATRFTSRYTPAAGRAFLEQTAQHTDYSEELAPGQYREIDVSGLELDCFLTALGGSQSAPFYLEPLVTSTTGDPLR